MLMMRRARPSCLFPYTTLFRSRRTAVLFGFRQPVAVHGEVPGQVHTAGCLTRPRPVDEQDRKSTRLNSSHVKNSYAVFCLKKKTKKTRNSEPGWDINTAATPHV